MNNSKIRPAAKARGILAASLSTRGSRSSWRSREIKMIKASCGMDQKVDNRMVKVRPRRMEVRYFFKTITAPYLILLRRSARTLALSSLLLQVMIGCWPSITVLPSA